MTYECRTKTVLFTMEVKKECSELWKQKKISNFGNKRISSNVANKRRFRTMDLRNDYDKTPVCKNRTGEKELSLF